MCSNLMRAKICFFVAVLVIPATVAIRMGPPTHLSTQLIDVMVTRDEQIDAMVKWRVLINEVFESGEGGAEGESPTIELQAEAVGSEGEALGGAGKVMGGAGEARGRRWEAVGGGGRRGEALSPQPMKT